MSLLFSLIAHLLVTLARLAKPGGLGAVVAESLGQTPAAHPEACAAACAVPKIHSGFRWNSLLNRTGNFEMLSRNFKT
jgi:hypothetical protein